MGVAYMALPLQKEGVSLYLHISAMMYGESSVHTVV